MRSFASALCLVALCLTGCAMNEQQQQGLAATMDALEDARFKGSVTYESGGSILGAHMRNSVWLGPGEQVFRFNGEVDFTETPRDEGGQ